jgi:hypothetical protein
VKPRQGSKTAELVCMGRAVADGRTSVPRFSDPTALALLPGEARAQVERGRPDVPARGLKARFGRVRLRHLATATARSLPHDEPDG